MRTLSRKVHSLLWLCYWMDLQGSNSISASGIYTCRRHIEQTGLQMQPASSLTATGGAFPGVTAAAAFTWQLSPIRNKNTCSQIAFPQTHFYDKLLWQEVSSSPKWQHSHWGPSSILFNCYCISFSEIKRPEPGKDYPFPYRVEVKHSCSYASAPHISLYGTILNQHTNQFTWARDYFLLSNIQTCYGAHPSSHSTDIVFLSLD